MKIGCVLYSDVVIGDQYPMTINNIYSVNLIHSHFTIKTIKLSYLWFVSTNSQVGKVKIYWFKCFVHNYTQTLAQVSPNLTKNFFHLNDFDRLDLSKQVSASHVSIHMFNCKCRVHTLLSLQDKLVFIFLSSFYLLCFTFTFEYFQLSIYTYIS